MWWRANRGTLTRIRLRSDGLRRCAAATLWMCTCWVGPVLAGEDLGGSAGKGGFGCTPTAERHCMLGGRFSVEAEWRPAGGLSVHGPVLPVAGDGWGFFYFDDTRYLELLVEVVDGCSINGSFWVFFTGLSDLQQTVRVTDTTTGSLRTYDHPAGSFPDVSDTMAFPCTAKTAVAPPRAAAEPILRLIDGRFELGLDWRSDLGGGSTGTGRGVPVTTHSGYFWLFAADDPGVVAKIVDASDEEGFFHVVFGGSSTLELTLEVADLCGGSRQEFVKAVGTGTVEETMAFPSTDCAIFSDGFESGDTSQW